MKLSLYGNKRQRGDTAPLENLLSILSRQFPAVQCSVQEDFMTFMRSKFDVPENITETFREADPEADLALSIGGDGTFLRTANRIGALQTPIMGLNSGHLGYMSAADITEAPEIIDDIMLGHYRIEPRTVLQVSGPKDLMPRRPYALNEVAILKKDTASMITVEAGIGEWSSASYRADGLIIATPTGSTGYNLSVGGPIVAPGASVWTMAPVAPHSLNMRPLVVPDTTVIELTVSSRADHFMLSLDGRSTDIPTGATLRVSRAPYTVNTVVRRAADFIATLREKLLWGRDNAEQF